MTSAVKNVTLGLVLLNSIPYGFCDLCVWFASAAHSYMLLSGHYPCLTFTCQLNATSKS